MKCVIFAILFAKAVTSRAQPELQLVTAVFITPCNPEDNKCLKNALEDLQPHLKRSIPEFNLQSIDPAILPDYQQSDLSSLEMPHSSNLTNIQCTGTSNFQVANFNVNLDKLTFNLEIVFPQLVLTANEVIWIKGFGLEVDGVWPIKKTYNKLRMSFSLNGTKYLKMGRRHLRWVEDHINVSFDEEIYEVGNAFGGTNEFQIFLNKASEEFPEIFQPAVKIFIRKTLGYYILHALNNVHEIYPIEVLYSSAETNSA